MRQILFTIPLNTWISSLPNIPIYGYGLMLFTAYILCTALGKRLCKRDGIDPKVIPDLTIWLFVAGIIGARAVFVIEYWDRFSGDYGTILRLWDGGLVFYGGVIGGAIGYFGYDYFVLRKLNISKWKMIDVVAPCIILGSALGRIGCLFTGCCYGNVACESCPALHFPIDAPASTDMLRRGNQTQYGFLFDGETLRVAAVEAGSTAAAAGLERGDIIVKINGTPAHSQNLDRYGTPPLTLTVLRNGAETTLPPFELASIGVHPTQIYESISMVLLLMFLLSYWPFRRCHGELMVFAMLGYGVHRFLNEMLRTDNEVVAFGLTLSQNISLLVIAAAIALAIIVYRRPRISDEPPTPIFDAAPASDHTSQMS
ncbi:MAG TPA: prolipoprotein diacylglyceryl transferase family protein [Gemmataceae bacterium]|nr:prolipoprotein diacylglyceryl transferase family protein [Gemmataceae bacterium]